MANPPLSTAFGGRNIPTFINQTRSVSALGVWRHRWNRTFFNFGVPGKTAWSVDAKGAVQRSCVTWLRKWWEDVNASRITNWCQGKGAIWSHVPPGFDKHIDPHLFGKFLHIGCCSCFFVLCVCVCVCVGACCFIIVHSSWLFCRWFCTFYHGNSLWRILIWVIWVICFNIFSINLNQQVGL